MTRCHGIQLTSDLIQAKSPPVPLHAQGKSMLWAYNWNQLSGFVKSCALALTPGVDGVQILMLIEMSMSDTFIFPPLDVHDTSTELSGVNFAFTVSILCFFMLFIIFKWSLFSLHLFSLPCFYNSLRSLIERRGSHFIFSLMEMLIEC